MSFTLIRCPSWHVLGDRAVLGADEVRTLQQAAALLHELDAMRASIAAEEARRYDDARRRGYDDGVAQARREGIETLAQLAQQADTYVATFEREIVALIVEAIGQLLPSLGADRLLPDLAGRALAACRHGRFMTLRVAPAQVEAAEAVVAHWRGSRPEMQWLQVVGDAALGAFECVAQTDAGSVRADLDSVMAALRASFDAASMLAEPGDMGAAPAPETFVTVDPYDATLDRLYERFQSDAVPRDPMSLSDDRTAG